MLTAPSLMFLLIGATVNGQDAQALTLLDMPAAFENSTVEIATCQQACLQLQATFDVPAEVAERYFTLQQRELKPRCVVQPESAEDVSHVVQVVKETRCQFAVRSGGHGNHAGASSIQDGLLIDLSKLNTVATSEDESVAMIGAGNRWGDVYEVLEEKGLLVVGGRSSSVGVAGFTLGGGISFLSRRYGWAVDNVRNYEVVLANGTIASVSRDNFPDLYYALRGGGNNFGIVVRFDFETYRHELLSGGTTVFVMEDLESRRAALGLTDQWQWTINSALSQINKHVFKTIGRLGFAVHSSDVIREFIALADEKQTDAGAHAYLFFSWVPSYQGYFFGMTRMYSALDPNPAVFQNISSLKKLYTTQRVAKMTDFVREINEQNMGLIGKRNIWRTMTLGVNADLISDILDVFLSSVHPYTAIPGALLSCNLQLLTKHEIELFAKNGGNPLGVHPDDGPLFLFSTTFGHKNAADDGRFETLTNDIMSKVASLAKERGLYHPFIYQNYAGPGQDVYAGYGSENRARLSKIQQKYDPEGIFRKLVSGYHKV
ncbi:hypothetical protein BDW75DRAFT_223885 [Aspergillus navahoensis]